MTAPPRKLSELIPPGRYEVPRLLEAQLLLPVDPQEGPIRILLRLEGGYELEVEATPRSRGELYQALRSVRPNE